MPLLIRATRSIAIVACTVALTSACGSRSVAPPVAVPPDTAPPSAPESEAVPSSEAATAPDPTAAAPVVAPAACLLGPEDGEPVESIGLTDAVDAANAPYPVNASEGLVFRQLYESPLRIDCEGTPRPALAESWRATDDGSWVLTVRTGARFTDGTPVTADAIVAAWEAGGGAAPGAPPSRHVRSVASLDSRRVLVHLRDGVSAPAVFAHADLAVFRRVPGEVWPRGTRLWRASGPVVSDRAGRTRLFIQVTDGAGNDTIVPGLQTLVFTIAPGVDGRDLLDEGMDLLVTRNPRALDYAATLPQFESLPLAWDRTHVLVSPTTGPVQALSADERDALARDAVRGEARGAATPAWLEAIAACPARPAPARPAGSPAMRRIVFDAGDDTARDLAERIVGLAGTRSPSAAAMLDGLLPRSHQSLQRAIGLAGQALASALKSGSDAGYVLAFARTAVNPCQEVDAILRQVPWFDPQAVVPLVESRARAVVRRGRSGVVHEGDGTILFGFPALEGRRPE
jgi:hypothetical protein